MRKVRRTVMLPKICETWHLSQRRGCRILEINRKMLHYRSVKVEIVTALNSRRCGL
ncbi:MAG: hypothetical protein WB810_13800 [Candidatus Cybelea sp.]